MDKLLNHKFKQVSVENLDEFLKASNVNIVMRKIASAAKPTSQLTLDSNGVYTLTLITPIKTFEIVFRLQEEIDEERPDGVKCRSTFFVEGDKLVQHQIEPTGRKVVHVREASGNNMIMTTTMEGWDGKCVRVLEKVE